jgi:type VI secretion system protein ImpF
MAFQIDVQVTLSVFDRLVDLEPRSNVEAPLTRAESVRRLRIAVRRDLEWLLNSRRVAVPPDPALAQLNESVYTYGIPDITSIGIASPHERSRLLGEIRRAIQLYEPRLTDVKVSLLDDDELHRFQRLDFRIEALLVMDPAPEAIRFDTTLDAVNQSYRIRTEGGE